MIRSVIEDQAKSPDTEPIELAPAELPTNTLSSFGLTTEAASHVSHVEMTARHAKTNKKSAPGQPFRALIFADEG